MLKLTTAMALLVLVFGLTACGEAKEGDLESNDASAAATSDGGDKPEGKFSLRCDYLLGDFTESEEGYRFVAGGDLENTSDVGIVVQVRAEWELLGSAPVVAAEKRRLQPGQSANVQITEVAGEDEIDAHQSAEGECDVNATIVDTF